MLFLCSDIALARVALVASEEVSSYEGFREQVAVCCATIIAATGSHSDMALDVFAALIGATRSLLSM